MACASLFNQAGRILGAVCAREQLQPGEEEQGGSRGNIAGEARLQTRGVERDGRLALPVSRHEETCHLFDPVWQLDKASSWFGNNLQPSKNVNNAATCAF